MVLQRFIPAATLPLPSLDFVEEINHRVANEYAEAIATLSLASRGAAAPAREACERAAARLRAHAAAHRALLPPMQQDAVNVADYLGHLGKALADASLADGGIRLSLRIDELLLPPQHCWRLGLIVAELVRNAARHGLSRGGGLILVKLAERSEQIVCLVCDNGRTPQGSRPGRGQRLVADLAAGLGGSADWWLTPRGGMVRVQFAVPVATGIAAAIASSDIM